MRLGFDTCSRGGYGGVYSGVKESLSNVGLIGFVVEIIGEPFCAFRAVEAHNFWRALKACKPLREFG